VCVGASLLVNLFQLYELHFTTSGRGWLGGHILSLLRQRKDAKKGDAGATALRVPNCARQKWGESETRLRLKHLPLFFPFLSGTIGSVTCEKTDGSTVHHKLFFILPENPLSQEKFDSRDAMLGASRSNTQVLRGQATTHSARKSNLSPRSIKGRDLEPHVLVVLACNQ
jgi:hypothetical protein